MKIKQGNIRKLLLGPLVPPTVWLSLKLQIHQIVLPVRLSQNLRQFETIFLRKTKMFTLHARFWWHRDPAPARRFPILILRSDNIPGQEESERRYSEIMSSMRTKTPPASKTHNKPEKGGKAGHLMSGTQNTRIILSYFSILKDHEAGLKESCVHT